jgi:hypothetical protein
MKLKGKERKRNETKVKGGKEGRKEGLLNRGSKVNEDEH